jgi:hypothetical protein
MSATNEDFPPQITNPARDLYKFWYSIVKYHAPHLLDVPYDPSEFGHHFPAAFTFKSGNSLHVDRRTMRDSNKPALYVSGVMRIWPNGHFIPIAAARSERWCNSQLDLLEEMTFLRWGYVARGKAIWVQDTPRRGHSPYAPDRDRPDAEDFTRRIPYLPLVRQSSLWHRDVTYRLVKTSTGKWVITTAGFAPLSPNEWSKAGLRIAAKNSVRVAQEILDRQYGIAERRYQRYARRAEIATQGARPRKQISMADRINLQDMMRQNMTVWEPKRGPGGTAPQMLLPLNTEEVTRGREDAMGACTVAP